MKTTLKIIFFLLTLMVNTHALSQSTNYGILKGTILSNDDKPAPFLTVELQRLKLKTQTNSEGNFVFHHLATTEDTLLITGIGYKIYKQFIHLDTTHTLSVGIIKLEYTVSQLQDVEIRGRIAQSYKSDYSFFSTKTETSSEDIPQSISTVTKELIRDKMELTLKEAADNVPGVNQYSGYDEYTIRGFRAENAHNINGLRGYNNTYTSSMLVNIERVEVIKGPVATLYGNCDPGGTVNLVTKKPLDKQEASIDVYGGSWDHFRMQGDVTGPLNKSKTLLYRLNAGYDKTNSFRDQNFAKSYEIAPSLTYAPNDHFQINADFSISHINTVLDRGQPGLQNSTISSTPIKFSLTQPGDYLHETDIASVISASYKFNKHFSFSTGYLNYITQQNVAEHGLNDYITSDSVYLYYSKWNYHTVTNTLTNYFTYKFNTGKAVHQLLAGYDFIRSSVDLVQQYYELPDVFGEGSGIVGTFSLRHPQYIQKPVVSYQQSEFNKDATNVDGEVYSTNGIYIQEQVSLNRWKLLLGLRQEFYKGGDNDDKQDSTNGGMKENILLPRVGLVYAIKPNVSLYATYNRGFDPFEASTELQVFDEPFKPITSELFETGIKGNLFKNNLSASLSLYQLTVKNVAVNANHIDNPNLFVQQGKTRSRGLETEAAGNILPNLSATLSYAYCDAKVIESKVPSQVGIPMENAPRHTSNSWIKYSIAKGFLKKFGIVAGHSQVSKRSTLDTDFQLPEFVILNAGLLYTGEHVNIGVNVNNLTNKTYWTAAYNNVNKWPGAPRNLMVRIGYQF
jgi:iron complex outermembrane receptor protein